MAPTSIDRLGYAINAWHVSEHLVDQGVPVLVLRPSPDEKYSRDVHYWFLCHGGKFRYKERKNTYQERSIRVGWATHTEAITALHDQYPNGWKRPIGEAFGGVWIPADTPDPGLNRRSKTGRPLPLKWATGTCCTYQRFSTSPVMQDCARLATETGLCKKHQSESDRRAKEDAAYAEATAERERAREEHTARFQREAEQLDELKPLLAELGVHPGVFEPVGPKPGDKVGVRVPAESLAELVRLAVLGQEVESWD